MDHATFERHYGALHRTDASPHIAAIDLATDQPAFIEARATELGLKTLRKDDAVILPEAEKLGGVCLKFTPSAV
ncbi:hypothetical protein ACMA5I_04370 [Paracoccaceae bacterium GXU_MW_L88]